MSIFVYKSYDFWSENLLTESTKTELDIIVRHSLKPSSDKHKNTNFYCTFGGTDGSLASQNDQGGRVHRRKIRFLYESFSKSKNNKCEVDATDLSPFLI